MRKSGNWAFQRAFIEDFSYIQSRDMAILTKKTPDFSWFGRKSKMSPFADKNNHISAPEEAKIFDKSSLKALFSLFRVVWKAHLFYVQGGPTNKK